MKALAVKCISYILYIATEGGQGVGEAGAGRGGRKLKKKLAGRQAGRCS